MTEINETNRISDLIGPLKEYNHLWEKLIGAEVNHVIIGDGIIASVRYKYGEMYIGVSFKNLNEGQSGKIFVANSFYDGKFNVIKIGSEQFKLLTEEISRLKQEKILEEKRLQETKKLEEEHRQEAIRLEKERKKAEWEAQICDAGFRHKLSNLEHLKVLVDFLVNEKKPQSEEILKDELFSLLSGENDILLWQKIPEDILKEEKFYSIAPSQIRIRVLMNKITGQDRESDSQIISQIVNILENVPIKQRRSMLAGDPGFWMTYLDLFVLFPDVEQVKIIREWSENGIKAQWERMSVRARILLAFKAAAEHKKLDFLENLEKNKLVLSALLILNGNDSQNRRFERAHNLFQDFVVCQAWDSAETLNLYGYLPLCKMGIVSYCEVKPWPFETEKNHPGGRVSRTFCPRQKRPCDFIQKEDVNQEYFSERARDERPYGARLYSETSLDWWNWSLLELIEATNTKPIIQNKFISEYVQKLSGWVNRLNEIRERLKCSVCGELMQPNMEYSKNMASYMTTVVSCRHGLGHDQNIYLNHCWACRELIDSRESSIRHEDFYLCIHCGSGPQKSITYTQGDICPKCGMENSMTTASCNQRHMVCGECHHIIRLPAEKDLTGDKRKRAENYIWKGDPDRVSQPEISEVSSEDNFPPQPDDWFAIGDF